MLAALATGLLSVPVASEKRATTATAEWQSQLLAQSCTSCHGSARSSAIPSLYGRKARRLEKYLLGYKRGTRKGTVMPRIARGYSAAQLTQLAAYFAQTKPAHSNNE